MSTLEIILVFENPKDGSTLQFEMDANGYSMTIFPAEGEEASMELDQASLVRLSNFLNDTVNEGAAL